MKAKSFNLLVYILAFWLGSISFAQAGQVVTDRDRTWVRQAVEQEHALKSVIEPNTIAVLYFHNKTDLPKLNPLQKGLALMLMTDLSSIKEIKLVERVRLQALMEELGLGISGLVKPETAPRVGKLLRAQYIIGGDILLGKILELKLDSALLEVQSGKMFGQPVSEGDFSEFFKMEKDLLFEIVALLKIALSPEQKKILQKPISTNAKALLFLFKGIEKSDLGNYQEAFYFYKKAFNEDPGLHIAGKAFKELQDLGLINKKKSKKKNKLLLKKLRKRTSLTDRLTPDYAIKRARKPKDIEKRQKLKINPDDVDNDGDGYTKNQGDYDDTNSDIHPGAEEICGDGIDQDCDGIDPPCPPDPDDVDNDGDGYTENQGDCNDNNSSVHPGAEEICGDGIDQDCDGIDPPCPPDPDDVDNDGDGYTENQGDCDDNNSSIHPGAEEICGDGIDQDCDGIDPQCPPDPNDVDNDGDYYTENQGDCNDTDRRIHPGAREICGDGIDQDCDGFDPACPVDNDGDGYTVSQGDCDDNNSSVHPGAEELCNDDIDNNCDGIVNEGCEQ